MATCRYLCKHSCTEIKYLPATCNWISLKTRGKNLIVLISWINYTVYITLVEVFTGIRRCVNGEKYLHIYPSTYVVEEGNQCLQVVLWLPHMPCSMHMLAHAYTHTNTHTHTIHTHEKIIFAGLFFLWRVSLYRLAVPIAIYCSIGNISVAIPIKNQ